MDMPGKDLYGVGLEYSVKKIQLDFRQYVAKVKGGMTSINLTKVFQQFDSNSDNKLDLDEFERGLTAYGVFLKKYEYQILFKYYDKDQNGTLDIQEFVDGIMQPLNERRAAIVEKVFRMLDRDGSGFVDVQDLSNRLDFSKDQLYTTGKKSQGDLIQEFINKFEGKIQDGKLSLDELKRYYQDWGLSIANDDFFVEQIEQQWMVAEEDSSSLTQEAIKEVLTNLRQRLIQLSAGNKDNVIIKKIFQSYDISKDDYLSLDEFERMMKRLEVAYNKKYVSGAFSKLDINNNGFIEFQEFYNFILNDPFEKTR